MKKLIYVLSVLIVLTFSLLAFGQVIPEGDAAKSLLDLLMNYKTLSPLAIGSAIIVISVQILKSNLFDQFFKGFKYKRALITVLGQIYSVVFMVINGQSLMNAVISGLFISGGAVAIYEAIKPFIEKKN